MALLKAVCIPIKKNISLSPAFLTANGVNFRKDIKMMRHCRLFEPEEGGEVRHAHAILRLTEKVDKVVAAFGANNFKAIDTEVAGLRVHGLFIARRL